MNWTDGRRKSLLSEIWLFIDLIQDPHHTEHAAWDESLWGCVRWLIPLNVYVIKQVG